RHFAGSGFPRTMICYLSKMRGGCFHDMEPRQQEAGRIPPEGVFAMLGRMARPFGARGPADGSSLSRAPCKEIGAAPPERSSPSGRVRFPVMGSGRGIG